MKREKKTKKKKKKKEKEAKPVVEQPVVQELGFVKEIVCVFYDVSKTETKVEMLDEDMPEGADDLRRGLNLIFSILNFNYDGLLA